MRVALIILSIIALIFIGSISWSLVRQEGGKLRTPTTDVSTSDVDNITLETWKNQIKADEKIERLTGIVEELAKKNGVYTTENISPSSTSQTGTTETINAVKPSGKFLALMMPTISPTLVKNAGIYGLFIFDANVKYSTYKDENLSLTLMPLEISYDAFLRNIKALNGKPYATNEIKTFPFRAFFMNPETTDTIVRLIIEMEGQTIALEMPKAKYPLLKGLLLGKGVTSITQTGAASTPTATPPKATVIPPPTKTQVSSGTVTTTKPSTTSTAATITSKTGTTIRIIDKTR